jgi:hypothetical protein
LTIIPRGRMPNPEARLLKVANRGRLAQLVSKTIPVSYVHLKPPFHFMQNGAGNAGGLRPTVVGAFKSSNNLMLAKDACSSAGHLVASATRPPRDIRTNIVSQPVGIRRAIARHSGANVPTRINGGGWTTENTNSTQKPCHLPTQRSPKRGQARLRPASLVRFWPSRLVAGPPRQTPEIDWRPS